MIHVPSTAPFRLLVACTIAVVSTVSFAHPPSQAGGRHLADREPDQTLNAEEEAFVHTPRGFKYPGEPKTVASDDREAGTLRLRIFAGESEKLAACRVTIVGPDGNFYEPTENRLGPWSRQRTNSGETHGPSRYFGWYFYTTGECEVRVPAGRARVEVWKGFEYRPVQNEVVVSAGETKDVRMKLAYSVPMDKFNYYSGDAHIHLNRRSDEEDALALDLMAAEDIRFGFLLCMNNPPSYSGIMSRQVWPQQQGLGPSSIRTHGRWGIASGQEYRTGTYGHICLLMHNRMVLEGVTTAADNWPPFDMIGKETRRLGGVSFHAHGGYSAEIYADYIRQSTDGVELLQMAHYRGIGLTGWYRILNCGFRFPGLAGSDFPYCRCLGDCRNYVYLDGKPDFSSWARAAAEGRSFFTTGPLVLLEVNGRRPGDVINLTAADSHKLNVRVRVRSEVAPFQRVDVVMGGKTVHSSSVPAEEALGRWHETEFDIDISEPTWIAARTFGISQTGRPDAEAHTNPVYVNLAGQHRFDTKDRDWLVRKLDGRIKVLRGRKFQEKEDVLKVFEAARQELMERSSTRPNSNK